LGDIPPIGRLFTLVSFNENCLNRPNFGILFPRFKLCINFDSKWFGIHFRWFFHKLLTQHAKSVTRLDDCLLWSVYKKLQKSTQISGFFGYAKRVDLRLSSFSRNAKMFFMMCREPYIHMYIYTYICTYIYTYVHLYTYICTFIYIHM
jgi:hypothetical protein